MLGIRCYDVCLITFLSLLLLIVQIPSTTAEITTVRISSDSRPTIRFTNFCFTRTGHVSIGLSNVSVTTTSSTPTNFSRLGFFLSTIDVSLYYTVEDGKTCITQSRHLVPGLFDPIATFGELSPPPLSSLNKTFSIPKHADYGIYFANCEPKTTVSMNVIIETFNIEEDGKKDYLPYGETQLPTVFFGFSLFYFSFLVIWVCLCCWRKTSVNKIHLLMAVLLLMKSLNLLFAAEDKHFINVTGTPHGWDILFYTFHSIRAVLLLTVIMLIGTGWSFLKPFLQENEKMWLTIGITLQVVVNTIYVFISVNGPFVNNYWYWGLAFVLVYMACYLVVLAPVVLSIKSLRETAIADGKAARTLAKIRLFRNFYVCVCFYEVTTILIKHYFSLFTILFTVANDGGFCGFLWVEDAFSEAAAVLFYVVMFHMFRPMEQTEYFVIHDEEDEKDALAIIRSTNFEIL